MARTVPLIVLILALATGCSGAVRAPEPDVTLEALSASRPGQFPPVVRLHAEAISGQHGLYLINEACIDRPCLVGSLKVPDRLEKTAMVQAMYDRAPFSREAGRLTVVLRVKPTYPVRPRRTGQPRKPLRLGQVELVEVVSLTAITPPKAQGQR